MSPRVQRYRPAICICLLLFGLLQAPIAGAHEIPASVVIQTWVQPSGSELNLLVRVPLEAMRDVVFPLKGLGYIDIAAADEALRDAAEVWIANEVDIFEGGRRLDSFLIAGVRLSLPSDRSFREYDSAAAHIQSEPLPASTKLFVTQALFDVHLVYPIASEASEFSIYPGFRRLGLETTTVIHFIPPGSAERVFEFSGDPGVVQLDPRWYHAFSRFVVFGFEHILDGIDHLLFLLCLIVPFRRVRPLIAIVTSFTVGHSLTLVGSAFGLTPSVPWFPSLIESLIALTIVYMALENIVGTNWRRRWVVAFGFGLVHGFGFSFALGESLQFAGQHLLASLLAFNLGVEFGQLLVVVITVPLLNVLFRAGLPERMTTIILSAILAHSGWHWLSDRVTALSAYSFGWPVLDASFYARGLRWLMLLVLTGLLLHLMRKLYARLMSPDQAGTA
ncbi:MAG: HupE/UreJ family protein [Woeseia sp.]|nr:HupE/UreJ family protein [Woeseia sp.]MBT8097533.1 HupE/UreJ family protein [Woeseia sp.]NNL55999.1 HupE/UreJ family protein [Woeseia sp.]